ncbi:MAG: hypothetical protein K2R93_12390 [Gemmatimonadaceae bacterium]|nr:hypothetical protein [Gemmatimonadaceae bacterium]
MSLYAPFGVPIPASPLESVSRCLFHLAVQSIEWDPSTGAIIAESGHTGLLTRAATASPIDINATTYTAQYHQLAFEVRPFLNPGTRDTAMLLMGGSDVLPFAAQFLPTQLCGLAEFVETTACGFRFSISNAAVSGASLVIDASGGVYRITHNNGSASVSASMGSGTSAGDRIQLYWSLDSSGVVQLWQTKLGVGQTTSGASGAPSGGLAAAWPASTNIYVNSNGTGTVGQMAFRRLKMLPTAIDFTSLQTVR